MTAKKAIELLKDFKAMTGQAVGEDIIEPIEQALTELDELKRDVKSFMELDNMENEEFNGYDYDVWRALKNKLSKVGK